jgi:hypothetical protein
MIFIILPLMNCEPLFFRSEIPNGALQLNAFITADTSGSGSHILLVERWDADGIPKYGSNTANGFTVRGYFCAKARGLSHVPLPFIDSF